MAAHANEMVRVARGQNSLGRTKTHVISWGQLGEWLFKPVVTNETFKAFLALPKSDQDVLKNVQGFWMGAASKDGVRRKGNTLSRRVVTLDFDNITPKLLEALLNGTTKLAAYEWYLHSTRKHSPAEPRVRLAILTKSEVSAEDYGAIARIIAWTVDATLDAVDDVSFRQNQMMFLPSHSVDSVWVWHHNQGKPVDPEAIFKLWRSKGLDPHNYGDLPYSEAQGQKRKTAEKAEDPFQKEGVVGAFCRAFPIEEAIAEFLSDFYVPGDMSGRKPRYSYTKGSASNGVEIQDDGRFLYSHHTSDPLSGMLANSWDAVRICRFGDLDQDIGEDRPMGSRPSFKAMVSFARDLPEVQRELAAEKASRAEEMKARFEDLPPEAEDEEAKPQPATEPALTLLTPDECAAMPARDYRLKGLIAPGDVGCIFGEPGAGKSLIAPLIGYRVAQGERVFGQRTKQGGVIYVAAEDGHGMRGRVRALRRELGPADDFLLVPAIGGLFDFKAGRESADLKALRGEVAKRRPGLIVIDTVAMAFPGLDENDANTMGAVVAVGRKLTEHGAAVAFVHHTPKNGDTPRGHSIFNGALDFGLLLEKANEKGTIRGKLTKNRNGSPDLQIAFRIGVAEFERDEDGDRRTAAYAIETKAEPRAKKLSAAQSAALAVLTQLSVDAGNGWVPKAAWRDAMMKDARVSAADKDDDRRRAAENLIKTLTQKKAVEQRESDFRPTLLGPDYSDAFQDETDDATD